MTDRQQGDSDQWPSFGQELGRKGLQTLQEWVQRVEIGTATKRDLYIVCKVLFDTMSGLAPWEDTDIVGAVHEELRQEIKRARSKA
jgi:hypothetical protein